MRTSITTTITTSTLAVAGALLVAGAQASAVAGQESATPADSPGATYRGDPWERRAWAAFWASQHVHDSWNRCHLGENAAPVVQDTDGCFPTLRPDTARGASAPG
jgi:hypothetical protein